jgi:phosphate butyryltransferase
MSYRISPITSSDQIVNEARKLSSTGKKKMVAVAGASDVDVLGAVSSAYSDGILTATLFAKRGKIVGLAEDNKIDISNFDIVDSDTPEKAAYEAVRMADEGKADIIMKGFVSSSTLLKTVLSNDFNLRARGTLSHAAVMGIPGYHKLLIMTDGGVVVAPNREQKKQILKNAIIVCRVLGISPIKAAISGAVDEVHDSVLRSVDARELMEELSVEDMNDVLVQGPLSFDSATSREAALRKKVNSTVAGDADIYLVNTIEECNIVGKSLINFAGAVFAGVILGAKVPISLVSRTDTLKNKKTAVSLACLISEYYSKPSSGGMV